MEDALLLGGDLEGDDLLLFAYLTVKLLALASSSPRLDARKPLLSCKLNLIASAMSSSSSSWVEETGEATASSVMVSLLDLSLVLRRRCSSFLAASSLSKVA